MRPPIRVERKPSSFSGNTAVNPGVDSRSYMSSSPFRAHAPQAFRSISPPSILGLPIGAQFNQSPPKSSTNTPPAAHHQGRLNRVISTSAQQNEPEVVDLTTKSPEKISEKPAPTRNPNPLPPPKLINVKNLAVKSNPAYL
jgi:hypothetical protein